MEMGSDHAQECDDYFQTCTKITEFKVNLKMLDMQQHAAKGTTVLLIYSQVKVLTFFLLE